MVCVYVCSKFQLWNQLGVIEKYLRDLLGQEELIRGKLENVLGVADRIVADGLLRLSVSAFNASCFGTGLFLLYI